MSTKYHVTNDPEQIFWAIPKGRMYDNLVALLKEANIELKMAERSLRPTVSNMPHWGFKLLKPRAIGDMLIHGTRDIGFLGMDLIHEQGYSTEDIVPILDTDLDRASIVVAAPQKLIDEARAERAADPNGKWIKTARGEKAGRDEFLDLPQTRSTPLLVATEYPVLAKRWIEDRGLNCEIVLSSGATEVYPPEDADFIIDNCSTGTTLNVNKLFKIG